MARKRNVLPSYLLHKASGQARVRINGRDHLLGPFGSEESRVKYGQLISQFAGGLSVDPLITKSCPADSGLSVAELLLAFKNHADSYHQTAERDAFNGVMRVIRELFAMLPAMDFSPLNLRAVRQKFVEACWSRGYCNKSTNKVRHIWKWGVSHGLVPHLANSVSSSCESCWFSLSLQFDTAVSWDEGCSFGFFERHAGVGSVEGMGHRSVVVVDEVSELIVEFWHRGEAAAAQAFAMDDAEDDFNLIEPRTVFREVHEPNAMARIGEKFAAAGLRLQDACHFFFPARRPSRTSERSTPRDWPTGAC